jgi:hypothetical protein
VLGWSLERFDHDSQHFAGLNLGSPRRRLFRYFGVARLLEGSFLPAIRSCECCTTKVLVCGRDYQRNYILDTITAWSGFELNHFTTRLQSLSTQIPLGSRVPMERQERKTVQGSSLADLYCHTVKQGLQSTCGVCKNLLVTDLAQNSLELADNAPVRCNARSRLEIRSLAGVSL